MADDRGLAQSQSVIFLRDSQQAAPGHRSLDHVDHPAEKAVVFRRTAKKDPNTFY